MNIDAILDEIKTRRRVFVSEADFQLELAWTIREMYPQYRIRLEYVPPFDKKMHIDIVVFTDEGIIPIELKYKTKACFLIDNGEEFVLTSHLAKDCGCYDYLKDIERIEKLKPCLNGFLKGYAIMLTNDGSYRTAPQNKSCIYYPFSIHENAVKKNKLEWPKSASSGTIRAREKPIELSGSYTMKWNTYSKLEGKNGTFYIMYNEIIKTAARV